MELLDAIIARLETTPEGSRELDCAIEIGVGRCDPSGELLGDEWHWNEWHPWGSTEAAEPLCQLMPHYTTSVDAALTLTPDDRGILIRRTPMGICMAAIEAEGSATGATIPLAVCIMGLKAKRSAINHK